MNFELSRVDSSGINTGMGIFNFFRNRSTVRVTDPDALSFLSGNASRSGVRVTEKTALSLPALHRGVSLVSERIAGLEIFVLTDTDEGNSPIHTHPASKLLRTQANPYQSALQIKTTLQKDKMIHGNGYGLIIRDSYGKPVELWRLDPTKTFPAMENGVLRYATVIDDEAVKLNPSDVIHIRRIGDSFVGHSIIELMSDCLGGAIQAQRHEAVFFRQGAKPVFAFKLPMGIGEQDIKRFREDWNRMQTGVENHHKIALLPSGFEIESMGMTPEQITLVDLKKFSLIDVANIVGVPPSFLGSEVNSSYASWEADAKSLLDNTIESHLNDWESELCLKLLSERQKERQTHCIRFDRSKLENTDQSKVVENATKKLQAGGISFNEYRKAISEKPIAEEWADKFVMPSNLSFIDDLRNKPEEPVQQLEQPTEPEQQLESEEKLQTVTRSICERLIKRLSRAIENKGSHDLCEAHLKTMTESLSPINERSGELCEKYLNELQEELNHALPEQVQPDANKLYEVIL